MPELPEVHRPYTAEDVRDLQGSRGYIHDVPTYSQTIAAKLWLLLQRDEPVRALGAITGNQAVQQVKAGLKAVYMSGWQVAADGNLAGQTYPDQSLYPSNSVPEMVKRVNSALWRADQIEWAEDKGITDWLAPVIADAEAGFGGHLNAYEMMMSMIRAGAAGVHFEDQLSSEKKCGHLGGKVLVPTSQFCDTLIAARLAADVCRTQTVIIARTDAQSAKLMTSDLIDTRDRKYFTGEKTPEGFYRITGGLDQAITRGIAYARYADLIWCETSTPNLEEAERFAAEIHAVYPGKLLAYNCSPSFHWKKHLSHSQIETFQTELAKMGYKFQFVTLAGFHSLNHSMFNLAKDYNEQGMLGYACLQNNEFKDEEHGYTAVKHQREVGTSYFDRIRQTISGETDTTAMKDSTEEQQFSC